MVQSNQRALQFQLLQLLEQAYLLNPERYEEQWRPYLSAFKLPMIRVLSEKMFEKVCLYAPDDIRLSLMLKNMNERPLNDILGHPRAQYVEGLLLRRTSITLAVANNIASMPNLTSLEFDDCQFFDEALYPLRDAVAQPNIHMMNFAKGNLNEQQFATLFARGRWPNIKTLKLTGIYIDMNALDNVTEDSGLYHLESLFAQQCNWIAPLAERAAASLKELHMTDCSVDNEELFYFLNKTEQMPLVELCLSDNPLNHEAALALASTPALKNLKYLDITNTRIGPGGVEAIERSEYFELDEFLHSHDYS